MIKSPSRRVTPRPGTDLVPKIPAKPRRLAIAFFYDEQGIVDDYMTYFVNALKPFTNHTIFIANGALSKSGEAAAHSVADEVIIRPNEGFDAWAYKAALEHVGFAKLSEFDEVLLFNHTCFGPIFPFGELFDCMDKRDCDFWGITEHNALAHNPFGGHGTIPKHLNSHFIAVRQPMLSSKMFRKYWDDLEPIESYVDSVVKHESKFTKYFTDLGYKASSYMSNENFGSDYPLMLECDQMVVKRCPLLKRRGFFGDLRYLERYGADLTHAIDLMRKTSSYPEELIWKNILRSSQLRILNENATLMSILPDVPTAPARVKEYGRIAVCAHMYYDDMIDEILSYTNNIPVKYDFLATTNTVEKKEIIETAISKNTKIDNFEVRLIEQNRGRDMSSLFITFRDIFLTDKYSFVCRVHTKKTPQVESQRGSLFKRHMLDNILHTTGYVTNVLNMFVEKPWVGLAIPPIVHISFYTFGHSWYNNRPMTEKIAGKMGLHVKFDDHTPVAPYGTMYWFRPPALRKMFEYEWSWGDYSAEPNHADGGMAHAQERVIAYVVQDAGFTTEHIASPRLAARNYALLEYKLSEICAKLPLAETGTLLHFLDQWRSAGLLSMTVRQSFREARLALGRSLRFRLKRRFRKG